MPGHTDIATTMRYVHPMPNRIAGKAEVALNNLNRKRKPVLKIARQ